MQLALFCGSLAALVMSVLMLVIYYRALDPVWSSYLGWGVGSFALVGTVASFFVHDSLAAAAGWKNY